MPFLFKLDFFVFNLIELAPVAQFLEPLQYGDGYGYKDEILEKLNLNTHILKLIVV